MKKLVFLSILLVSIKSYSQTAVETIDYISSVVQSYLFYNQFEVNFQDDNIRVVEGRVHDTHETTSASFMDYKQIKSVIYRKVTNDDNMKFYSLEIFGNGKNIDIYKGTSVVHKLTILLSDDLPELKMKKLIVAIKHIAVLNGAKLINENLF